MGLWTLLVGLMIAASLSNRASAQGSQALSPTSGGIKQRLLANTNELPRDLENVTVEDRLGQKVDGSITLTNSLGETVRLGDYFDSTKPVILAMVYYNCPLVCPVTLSKLQACLNEIEFTVGEDFRVVVVSFNPDEQTPTAASVKESNLIGYTRGVTPSVREGWTFHTATEANSKALADQVGFHFNRLPNGEYSHPVSTIFLTPDGTVSRYIHGFELPKRDVELALLEASKGTISKDFGHLVATFCYRFDPASGSYALSAFRVMQIGGALTVVFLIALVGSLVLRERLIGKRRTAATQSPSASSGPTDPSAAASLPSSANVPPVAGSHS